MTYSVRNEMRAVRRDHYGWADLRVGPADLPEPGAGQVRVRVAAAGVDRGTCHVVTGTPHAARLAFGLRRPRNPVVGLDVAGVIDAVGPDVTDFAVGDHVMGTAAGALAEYVLARPDRLVQRPDGLDVNAAAALPVSGSTALQAVRDHGRLQPGQRVLIIGASGGVGTYAVQIARALGAADVVAVCSAAKADLVRDLGATVIDYATTPLPADGSFDLIVDIGGAAPLSVLRRALRPSGRIVMVGAEGGGPILGGVRRQLLAALGSTLRKQKAVFFIASEDTDRLQALLDLVTSGAVSPQIDRVVALNDAPEAIRYVEDGKARGKVVVRVAPDSAFGTD